MTVAGAYLRGITSEGGIVKKPALALLQELGWQHVDLHGEQPGPANPTGRTSFHQAYFPAHLKAALRKLNPALPAEALNQAETELTRDRSAMLPVTANQQVLSLIRMASRFRCGATTASSTICWCGWSIGGVSPPITSLLLAKSGSTASCTSGGLPLMLSGATSFPTLKCRKRSASAVSETCRAPT